MQEIDMDNWDRKEHFNLFLRSDLPFYNVNFDVDVTGLKAFCKERALSLTHTLIYATLRALNRIENFRYRFENGKVLRYDHIDPSFTYLREGEELFRMITVDLCDDLFIFDALAKTAVRENRAYFDLAPLKERSNFVFISPMPWIPFKGVDHTLSLNKEDAIPRITWGKIYSMNAQSLLPFNIQVNHLFIDGLHVGRFYENLNHELQAILGIC